MQSMTDKKYEYETAYTKEVVLAAKRSVMGRAIREGADPVLTAADFSDARGLTPRSITPEILEPYKKFMEERV